MSTNQFQLPILFEDENLVILNKPAGVVVNDAQTSPGETIQGWMSLKLDFEKAADESIWQHLVPVNFDPEFGTPLEIFRERQGMVHRLDKNTSGVLVWAKNPGSLAHLLAQFKGRQVKKEYTALVHGKLSAPKASLSYPLGRASRDRKLFAVTPDGKPAVTEYELQQVFDGLSQSVVMEKIWPQVQAADPESHFARESIKTPHELLRRLMIYQGFSLIACQPLTGRTHQIRVHLAHIRHPIVGDSTYVGRKRQVLDPLWCPRHFLHASKLTLVHPETNQNQSFLAELPQDLKTTLSYLTAT